MAEHHPASQRLRDALLGSQGRGESRLSWPAEVKAKLAILDSDRLLRHDAMYSFDEITPDNVPKEIYSGHRLRNRTPRAERLAHL